MFRAVSCRFRVSFSFKDGEEGGELVNQVVSFVEKTFRVVK